MFLFMFLEFLNNKGKYCVPCCIQKKKKHPTAYSSKYGTHTQSQITLDHNNLCHETVPFLLSFGWPVFQCIQNIAFEKLLIRHSHLYWVTGWAMLTIPE